jgi:hypothetical protein
MHNFSKIELFLSNRVLLLLVHFIISWVQEEQIKFIVWTRSIEDA